MGIERIAAWHAASGIPYPLPNLAGPGWLPVLEARAGALGMKAQIECFLWLDPDASRFEQGRTLVALERAATERMAALGLDEAVAWLPPGLEPSFGPVLARRGWVKSPWPSWSRRVEQTGQSGAVK